MRRCFILWPLQDFTDWVLLIGTSFFDGWIIDKGTQVVVSE